MPGSALTLSLQALGSASEQIGTAADGRPEFRHPLGRHTVCRMAPLTEDDPRHGTTDGYGNHKCRCARCRKANTIAHAEYLARVRREGRTLGRHGTGLSYDSGCRCDTCREAHNKKSRDYKRKRRESMRQQLGGAAVTRDDGKS